MYHEIADAKFEYNQTMEELNKNPYDHEYGNKAFIAKDKFNKKVEKILYLAKQEKNVPD